jgi:hypothetical protein
VGGLYPLVNENTILGGNGMDWVDKIEEYLVLFILLMVALALFGAVSGLFISLYHDLFL